MLETKNEEVKYARNEKEYTHNTGKANIYMLRDKWQDHFINSSSIDMLLDMLSQLWIPLSDVLSSHIQLHYTIVSLSGLVFNKRVIYQSTQCKSTGLPIESATVTAILLIMFPTTLLYLALFGSTMNGAALSYLLSDWNHEEGV